MEIEIYFVHLALYDAYKYLHIIPIINVHTFYKRYTGRV